VAIIFLLLSVSLDSLKLLIENTKDFNCLLKLNDEYRRLGLFDTANKYLKNYEKLFGFEEEAQLNYLIGENLFFKCALLNAREQYLITVARFSNARYANESLERLHLFESARKDTILLKKLARSIYFYEIKDFKHSEDSLKALIKTSIGDYALYYLSLIYYQNKNFDQALSALEELHRDFPANRIHQAILLKAEIYFSIGRERDGIKILQDIIIKKPNSPIGIRAREILKERNKK
jgi:tetratricopeptide (TPR) repeat protein